MVPTISDILISTHFERPEMLLKNVFEIVIDNLSVGIDPNISKIFIQSMIPHIPHIELTRKIARRFNGLYKPVLTLPEALLGSCPRLPGIDGNAKMGKSLGNAIYLSDSSEEVEQKIRNAKTDTNRISLRDKGNPDACKRSLAKAMNIMYFQ